MDKEFLGDCWQWEASGQCSKGDNCSFRHDVNKRAKKKKTQPNPSPNSFMQQSERETSITPSPRGKSPSGGQERWGPQGMPLTGGGGLARVPNLRVCEHPLDFGVAHAGVKDDLTSCRGTV